MLYYPHSLVFRAPLFPKWPPRAPAENKFCFSVAPSEPTLGYVTLSIHYRTLNWYHNQAYRILNEAVAPRRTIRLRISEISSHGYTIRLRISNKLTGWAFRLRKANRHLGWHFRLRKSNKHLRWLFRLRKSNKPTAIHPHDDPTVCANATNDRVTIHEMAEWRKRKPHPPSYTHEMAEWRKRKDGPGRDGGRTSCETLPHHDPSVLHVLRTLQHTLLISPYPLLRFHDLTNCDTQYPHSRSRIFLWQLKWASAIPKSSDEPRKPRVDLWAAAQKVVTPAVSFFGTAPILVSRV